MQYKIKHISEVKNIAHMEREGYKYAVQGAERDFTQILELCKTREEAEEYGREVAEKFA